ncbi:hypothetical protein HPB50_011388 [Hyalomma asiaticum]|uniref:Uncharacterized protein n=1 Tax=Hyalomma asiaticum TaxID=266040 RepID=A0ACB7T9S4_HYAAI|nr:hypothetical protein HPB50_011388 [Hyalomma asiaticum]
MVSGSHDRTGDSSVTADLNNPRINPLPPYRTPFFAPMSGVRAIFCGHYHRNAGGFYKDMEVVVTSAVGAQLGCDTHGLRVVKVGENKIEHQYYALDDIPRMVSLH